MGIIYAFQNLALEDWKQYVESKSGLQSLKLYIEPTQKKYKLKNHHAESEHETKRPNQRFCYCGATSV